MMRLEKGVPFTSQNLASALQDDEGTFLCQHGGQSYIVEAQSGHSIVSGPTPVGPRVAQLLQAAQSNEPWTITKIEDRPIGFRSFDNSRTRETVGSSSRS